MWRRYARFFGADPVADVDDELRFHLETKTEELIAQGWRPRDAREEAERQFGDVRMIRRAGKSFDKGGEQRNASRSTRSTRARTCATFRILS